MCIFSCSICLFENLADGKFQNLGNWIFSFDILMPLYYCVVAMINKFNKYIYRYKIIIIKVVIIVIINIIE